MMMLGEKIGAEQAEDWGLIYKAVEGEALMDEAMALATRLSEGPTVSYSTMKANIQTALDGTLSQVLLAEAEGQRVAGASADAMEGAMAFVEKRKAAFKGK
jgi:2-(1,2-epoxy-1,2-dihydrophenyl)acetyl-CoA isomerase